MKKKKSSYERFMLACINSLPFTFHSPGEPNIPETREIKVQKPLSSDKRYRVPDYAIGKSGERLDVQGHQHSIAKKPGYEKKN